MTKPVFKKIEFYVTNVCNLTCDHCNRFNNFNFKGWQNWKDYEADYQRWGELIDLRACTIMGGEPLLNPSIVDWITGINRAFRIGVQVLTNGTRLNKVPGLYDAIATLKYKIKPSAANQENSIAVSLHNLDDLEELIDNIHDFLPGPVYQNRWNPDLWGCDYQYGNNKNVFINVYKQNKFDTSSILVDSQGKYQLHNNDPIQAHNECTFVTYKSYHFIRAKLYKCGPAALLPEFDQQHPFDLSTEDREILYEYQPLTVDNFTDYGEEFLKNLDNPIAQCKFCPTMRTQHQIFPIRKGTVNL
jgi:organic radical activating enzyme